MAHNFTLRTLTLFFLLHAASMSLSANDVPVGLKNLGNTCYMNSVLQCLFACNPLMQQLAILAEKKLLEKRFVASALYDLFNEYRQTKEQLFSPHAFLQCPKLLSIFEYRDNFYQQNDANELLTGIIDRLADPYQGRSQDSHELTQQQLYEVTQSIKNIFYFPVKKIFKCSNGVIDVSSTIEEMNHLILEPQEDINNLDYSQKSNFHQIFKNFSLVEDISSRGVKCPSNESLSAVQAWFKIGRTPPILIINVKRFTPLLTKAFTHISYDMKPLRVEAEDGVNDYQLFGCIIHIGYSIASGHYVCVVRYGHQWYLCNDATVTPITPQHAQECIEGTDGVINGQSYIFFFERVGQQIIKPVEYEHLDGLKKLYETFTQKTHALYFFTRRLSP